MAEVAAAPEGAANDNNDVDLVVAPSEGDAAPEVAASGANDGANDGADAVVKPSTVAEMAKAPVRAPEAAASDNDADDDVDDDTGGQEEEEEEENAPVTSEQETDGCASASAPAPPSESNGSGPPEPPPSYEELESSPTKTADREEDPSTASATDGPPLSSPGSSSNGNEESSPRTMAAVNGTTTDESSAVIPGPSPSPEKERERASSPTGSVSDAVIVSSTEGETAEVAAASDARDADAVMESGEGERPKVAPAPRAASGDNGVRCETPGAQDMKNDCSTHRLRSLKQGDSEIEQLAHRIETKRANRIPITHDVRKRLLNTCRGICERKGYEPKSKIHLDDLVALRDGVQAMQAPGSLNRFVNFFGFRNGNETFLRVLDRALFVVNEIQLEGDDWFYFQDFNFYHTRVESKWPWMRNPMSVALLVIFLFYFFTPILFCHIVKDRDVCPEDPTGRGRSYYGWLSSLYYASTTMSTVGYGDITVEKDTRWKVFIGIVYMIVALVVAIQAFGAAADAAFSPFAALQERFLSHFTGNLLKGELLYQRIRRLKAVKLTVIVVQFTVLNLIGLFVSRLFVRNTSVPEEQWTWMGSLYWAVQTTTTIGYGDMTMSFNLRWFQVFYLTLSTYAVGSALGKLASLKEEILELKRYYAWERREVSKGMIEEMQAYEHDDKVDQYEFVVASLLTLGKISSSDVQPIMDKFRELAGEKGFIKVSEDADDRPEEEDEVLDFDHPADENLPKG